MLRNKQNKSLFLSQAKTKQRFAIRKLTIGAASVLLGLTFLGVNGQQVHAGTGDTSSGQTEEVKNSDTGSSTEGQSQSGTEQNSDAKSGSSDTSADTGSSSGTTLKSKIEPASEGVSSTDNTTTVDKDAAVSGVSGNTTTSNKVNGASGAEQITNVPNKSQNANITYDYSVSAKDKTTGTTEAVHTGTTEKDNSAVVNTEKATDITAHLTLTNNDTTDHTIGNNDSSNSDVADLFINVWTGSADHTLKIDSSTAATVTTTKDGQTTSNDLTVYYQSPTDGKWYTYKQLVDKYGQDEVSKVTQIGFKGTLAAETTADMAVPLVVDNTATNTNNAISVNGLVSGTIGYAKQINVTTTSKEWDKDDVQDQSIHITYRNSDGSYSEVENESEIEQALSNAGIKLGDVLTITSSGNPLDTSGNTLYKGGTYTISLAALQAVLQKCGYSVDPESSDLTKLKSVYTYGTKGGLVVTKKDSNGNTVSALTGNKYYFYVEVHKIISADDTSFEEGSTEAQNFDPLAQVTSVTNLTNPVGTSTGYALTEEAGDKSKVTVTGIKDSNGNTVDAINGSTPAGTYYVTVSYPLNGSSDSDMQISYTYKVTITPNSNGGGDDNGGGQTQPTSPTSPTSPTQPTTEPVLPEQPTTPVTPSNPTQPSNAGQTSNIAPKSENTNNGGTKTHIDYIPAVKATSNHRTSGEPEANANVAPKAEKVSGQVEKLSNESAKSKVNGNSSSKSLPQTGEKKSSLGLIGLMLAALAGVFGLGFRKRER